MKDLYSALSKYSRTDMYPFHMPGHKRRSMDMEHPERLDITEIHGFDDLHHATGILKDAQERAAGLYGALDSFFLVNGSTSGVLAAVYASLRKHGRLLMARNCHIAVYHAAELAEATTAYVYPMETGSGIQGSIFPDDVKKKLEEFPDTEAVIVTSPTYDGVTSDICAIARIVHEHGAVLIVDEAHGAHFGFGHGFPKKAAALGADLVVESLHKTLPSFTQTAILHRCTERIGARALKKYLDIFQTSSPSYLFLGGMDRLTSLLARRGESLFSMFETRLTDFYKDTKNLKHMRILPAAGETSPYKHRGVYARDRSRILIFCQGMSLTGKDLASVLRERFHLEMEMSSLFYTTALTGIMDTAEGFIRLKNALHTLDEEYEERAGHSSTSPAKALSCGDLYAIPPKHLEIWEAGQRSPVSVKLADCAGAVLLDYICLYPPGIPILVPGEQMTEERLKQLVFFRSLGFELHGMADETGKYIQVLQKDFL